MPERHVAYPEEDIEEPSEPAGEDAAQRQQMSETTEHQEPPTISPSVEHERMEWFATQWAAALKRNAESYPASFPSAVTVRDGIARLLGTREQTPEHGEAAALLIEKVLDWMETREPDDDEVDEKLFFAWIDAKESLLRDIPLHRLFPLAVRMEKSVCLFDSLKDAVSEQTFATLQKASEEERARLVAEIGTLPLPRALDTLFVCEKFGSRVLRYDDIFTDSGFLRLRELVQRVAATHRSPIAQIQARHIDENLRLAEDIERAETEELPQRITTKGEPRRIEELFPNLRWPEAPNDAPLTKTQRERRARLFAAADRNRGDDVELIASDAACVENRDGLAYRIVRETDGKTMTYERLAADPDLNPFAKTEERDLPLLLQHLHSPALRLRVENDLGIRLRDIPLRSQIHLLRFLADQDATGYNRLRDTLHTLPDAAPDIAHSFLAFAEHPELGNTVLATAELLRDDEKAAKKLFGAYATFARSVDWETSQILGVGAHALQERMPERSAVLRHLLHRANHLFVQAEQDLAAAKGQERSDKASALTADFRREGDALRRQVTAFQDVADKLTRTTDAETRERYRQRLAAAFRELVLGEQPYQLPEQFFDDMERQAAHLAPERLPHDKPLYFPVGISRDLPHWQEVWEGKAEAAKPIDLYAWLFWLQNQGRPVELVVCDTMQTTNFQTLYPELLGDEPETAAHEFAQRIGKTEREQYQRIIDTFGLTNIHLVDYDEFRDRHQGRFERYRTLCTKLADMPVWQSAFLEMVRPSVAKEAPAGERRKLLPYAIEEVAWILATRGAKVSHRNEAPYDAVAAVLMNIEAYAEQHGIALEELVQSERLTPILEAVRAALEQKFHEDRSKIPPTSERFQYLGAVLHTIQQRILKTHHLPPMPGEEHAMTRKNVAFPFAVPETGSQSFGWRGKGNAGEEVAIGFREPYSTYFAPRGQELLLESDQIVALPLREIAGKILALPREQQAQYADRVLKPLLAQFYRVLKHAPQTYGYRLGRPTMTPREIQREFRSATSLYELIEKIQQYVVEPAMREHPSAIII